MGYRVGRMQKLPREGSREGEIIWLSSSMSQEIALVMAARLRAPSGLLEADPRMTELREWSVMLRLTQEWNLPQPLVFPNNLHLYNHINCDLNNPSPEILLDFINKSLPK